MKENTEEAESRMQKIADLVTKSHKYHFTQEEQHANSQQLAQLIKDKSVKEVEKKSVMKQFSDEIEKFDKDIKVTANYVNDGYMFRDIPCELWLDFEQKKRLYVSKNDKEIIATEDFHNSDYQKLIDSEAQEEKERILERQRQSEINENNQAGNFAEGQQGSAHVGNGYAPMEVLRPDAGNTQPSTEDWGNSPVDGDDDLPDFLTEPTNNQDDSLFENENTSE